MFRPYFRDLYIRTMREAYSLAFESIADALHTGGQVLDCGANTGGSYERLQGMIDLDPTRYAGIEWSEPLVKESVAKGLNVIQGDLNRALPFDDGQFRCVFGLSVLEHLLNGCAFMRECHRVLEDRGTLVLLTPNISTFFTIALLLVGKMPSTAPGFQCTGNRRRGVQGERPQPPAGPGIRYASPSAPGCVQLPGVTQIPSDDRLQGGPRLRIRAVSVPQFHAAGSGKDGSIPLPPDGVRGEQVRCLMRRPSMRPSRTRRVLTPAPLAIARMMRYPRLREVS